MVSLEFKLELKNIISFVNENLATLSTESKIGFMEFLNGVSERMARDEEVTTQEVETIPDTARLLWVASGGDVNSFINFMEQYPDPSLYAIRKNPQRLIQIITALIQEMPKGEPTEQDGIPSAWLPSSNIWGFGYDDSKKRLRVKFQGGKVYEYTQVPKVIFDIFKTGAVSAKTKGKNRYGQWWVGKRPSLGAAFHQLIKLGGFPYQRLQ